MPYLTITAADGRTFQRPLDKELLTVGRSSKNDVNLSFDLSLSRFHAEILKQGDRFLVRDVGSRNGTSLNGKPVPREPIPLNPGDRITLGETTILFAGERPPEVVLEDSPISVDTSTYSIPVEEIITHSRAPLLSPKPTGVPTAEISKTVVQDFAKENRTVAIMTRAGMELVSHRPYEEVLETIMDLVFEAIPAERGFLMLLEGEAQNFVSKAARDTRSRSGGSISLSRSIANLVIQQRQAVLTQDAQRDERFKMQESVVLQGIRSAMCVPLWNNKEVIGLVYVDTLNTSRSFKPEDLKLLTVLANIAAVKIENARLIQEAIEKERMEKELEQAKDIQNRLLPTGFPGIEGYEIVGRADACREVGGDYFDFVERPASLGIVVGDVSGKGMAAALLMASVQAIFRTLADVEPSPGNLMRSLNRHLIRSANPNKFVSFFYGELDRATGRLRYVNAGHNPPILLKTDGSVQRLPAGGVVLGIFVQADYTEAEATLEPGDLLALYSDGVTECQNVAGDEYGEERLIAALEARRSGDVTALQQEIFKDLRKFAGEAPQYDDSTLVIVKRTA